MVAIPQSRRKGIAREAVQLMQERCHGYARNAMHFFRFAFDKNYVFLIVYMFLLRFDIF